MLCHTLLQSEEQQDLRISGKAGKEKTPRKDASDISGESGEDGDSGDVSGESGEDGEPSDGDSDGGEDEVEAVEVLSEDWLQDKVVETKV